jgi:hypothetical protein
MKFEDLYKKIRAIDEGAEVAPVHTDAPTEAEGIEIIGGPMGLPGILGGHTEAPKQADNVTMNVSLNGQGSGGVRSLMNILKDIEDGGDNGSGHALLGEPHDSDAEEPIMGDMIAHMAHEEDMEETFDDDKEVWGNSAHGGSGHHTHGIDAITFSGDDMNSKGKVSPLARAPGTNALQHPMHESLVDKLTAMYETIKEERTEEKDENGNVIRWKEEGEWTKVKKDSNHTKSGRGKVTNMSDKARREMEKMAKKDVKENAYHEDDEERKIRHLMRKYGWSRQEALEYYHYEEHDPADYEDMEESAKWRDPKYKGQLFTQEPRDHDKYDYSDDEYYNGPRPTNDPGDKYSTFDRDSRWTDPLYARHSLPKDHNDPESWGYGSVSSKGKSKGKVTASHKNNMKNNIQGSLGQHHTPNLPEQMNESAEVNAMLALNKRLNG